MIALVEAPHTFNGHKHKAIQDITEAIEQVKHCIDRLNAGG